MGYRICSFVLCICLFSVESRASNWWERLFGKKEQQQTHSIKKQSYAADASQVAAATCRPQSLPTVDEMEAYLLRKSFYPRESFNHNIMGITLYDQSIHMVDLFRRLTITRGGFDSECEDIICLATQVFNSRKDGIMYLYMLSKYKLNFSPFAKAKAGRRGFKDSDLRLFQKALQSLPESVFEGTEYKVYNRYYPGQEVIPPEIANSMIGGVEGAYKSFTLFPKWFSMESDYRKEYFLVHELAHMIDLKKGTLSATKEWLDISGWEMVKYKQWDAKKKNTIVSGYALDSIKLSPANAPQEDFAEALAAYRYRPQFLKSISLEKYEFIKEKVFDGVIFESNDNCLEDPIIEVSDFVKRKYSFDCKYQVRRPYLRFEEVVNACYEYHEAKTID